MKTAKLLHLFRGIALILLLLPAVGAAGQIQNPQPVEIKPEKLTEFQKLVHWLNIPAHPGDDIVSFDLVFTANLSNGYLAGPDQTHFALFTGGYFNRPGGFVEFTIPDLKIMLCADGEKVEVVTNSAGFLTIRDHDGKAEILLGWGRGEGEVHYRFSDVTSSNEGDIYLLRGERAHRMGSPLFGYGVLTFRKVSFPL